MVIIPRCPFCSKGRKRVNMEKISTGILPDWIGLEEALKSHPIPVLRRWIKTKIEEAQKKASGKVLVYRCPSCKFIAFFEV